ncbi:MAG TPA: DUF4157 domain-containing protein [Terriglobia bacterium]|jgi:hypothetical protein
MGEGVTVERKSKRKAEVSAEHAETAASAADPASVYGAPAGMPLFLAQGVQRKPAVGAVDDPSEREADQVAEKVMGSVDGPSGAGPMVPIQRQVQDKNESAPAPRVSPSAPSNVRALDERGSQLPPATRTFFESRFGADFSQVRVHTDAHAAGTAKAINAKAFTAGRNIAFSAGQYEPESNEGRRLLAHELTHVIQQEHTAHVQRKVFHSILKDGTDELSVWMLFRGEYLGIDLRPDAETGSRFDTDPGLLDKLDTAMTAALAPAGVPVPETRGFLVGPVVRRLVENDLPGWVDAPDSSLSGLVSVLNKRAAEFRKQAVRADLEAYLGVDPGTIDWPAVLPGIHSDFDAKGEQSLHWKSLSDRADFVLLVLETEVATAPAVVGGVVPPKLSDSVWDFAMSFNLAPGTSPKAFSEKYLGEYVQMIAALEFVPPGFDLTRYKPSGADLAADRRHVILDTWIAANAVEATTRFVLDDWTMSGLDFKVYLSALDLDAKKSRILDKLTDAFLMASKSDPELNSALVRMADRQAAYELLAKLVTTGHAAEKSNRELVAAIDDPEEHPELDDLAGDPRTIYESEFYLAQGINTVLSHVGGGARVDVEIVTNAVAIAGKADFPPNFGLGAFLLVLLTELNALAAAKDTERAHARAEIAERVDLSWEAIKKIIDNRGKEADKFLDGTWIPMLKTIANEWVDANYKELKDAYDNFNTWAPQNSGRYKLAAWMIEDVANKLETGEIKSSTINGATVTIDNVEELRTAVTVLRGKAAELDSPKGRADKREELQKAIDAYGKVKANIADGSYKPENYGEAVVVEAKTRLKIGLFEYTSLWQQATRQVVVRDNPFQAYTIAMWRVTDIIDTAVANLLMGFLRGALLIGSLIVPGVGALILTAIDIGIGVYSSAKNLGEARRRLDLARLDTQLQIQGVTVEAAEHALTMAWVSFVIELATAGLFGALVGKLALKGIRAMRLPALTKLAETDAALAAKLVERIGDAKLTDTLLGHFSGDGNKLFEALAYVKDGKSLTALIGKVKDAEVLSSLLISAGSDTKLFELLDKFKNVNKLDTMLGVASRQQLLRLIALTKDETMVARLVEGMGPGRALSLMDAGLTAEHAITLDRLGEDAVRAFSSIAATGDAEAIEGAAELLRLNQKGVYSSQAAASALVKTAEFGEKYAGRVSGDFVSRFARVAKEEANVAKIQGSIAAAGKGTTDSAKALARAQAALARAKAETNAATDILEGRTVFGKDRSVRAIPESDVKGVETPEFSVTGGGKPDALAEVKAIGDEAGKIGKDAIKRNFRKAASQISGHAAKGQSGGLVRLDAGSGTFPQTNADIVAEVRGQWLDSIRANPERANDVGWVEVLDKGAAGESRRLLLKVDGGAVTIDVAGTTRL